MKINLKLIFSLLISFYLIACTTTSTEQKREASARPRVEQRALSNAINIAFKEVDFSVVIGKKVFIDTQALSKLDVGFINGFITGLILQKGGLVVPDEKDADIKMYNVVKVSGTDEIVRKILSDKVRGEYSSTLSIIDLKTSKIIKTYVLSGEADENR